MAVARSGMTCVTLTYLTCPTPNLIVACPKTLSAIAFDALIRSIAPVGAPVGTRARIHALRHADVDVGNRGHHGGLHRRERRAAAPAALRRLQSARRSVAHAGGAGHSARRPVG